LSQQCYASVLDGALVLFHKDHPTEFPE